MCKTSFHVCVSDFRRPTIVWVLLVFLFCSFFPSASIAQSTAPSDELNLKEFQTLLQYIGYDPGPIDGKMGQKTTMALEAFQTDRNIPVNGEPSMGLLGVLQRELGNVIGQRVAHGEIHIKDVQVLLQQLGYEPGPFDGKMGKKTAEAIKTFQTEKGLAEDDELSADVLQALHKEFLKVVGPSATISAIEGSALVNGEPGEQGTVLIAGDSLENQADTAVELTLSDGSRLEVEAQTRIQFETLSQTAAGARHSVLTLSDGRVRALLSQAHQHTGSVFTVATPNAKIDATFSEPDIEVSYSTEKLETLGIAHTVQLMAKNLAKNEEVLVPVGSTVIITSDATKVIAGIILSSKSIEPESEEIPEPEATPEPLPSPEPVAPIAEVASGMGKGTMIAIGAGALAAVGGIVALAGGGGGSSDASTSTSGSESPTGDDGSTSPPSTSPSDGSTPDSTTPATAECADIAGNWGGTYEEIYCDGDRYSGTWTAIVTDDCFISEISDEGNATEGVITGETFYTTGFDEFCGTINSTGTIREGVLNGTYSYAQGGGGTLSGVSRQ